MATRPGMFRPHPARTKQERGRDSDQHRGSAVDRGYTWRWAKSAKGHLRNDPLCRYCALEGVTELATCVDHFYPHEGDTVLFWQTQWWVSSCKRCHDGFKQGVERQGKAALDALARRLGLPVREVPRAA